MVKENEDKEVVRMIREGLKKTGGYCPCKRQRTPENVCTGQKDPKAPEPD